MVNSNPGFSFARGLYLTSLLMILLPGASALVVHIDLTIYENNTVQQDQVAVLEGTSDQPMANGNALLILWQDEEHYRTKVPLSFFALDPYRKVEKTFVSANIPYIGNKGSIILMSNQTVLWTYDLSKLCDKNKVCSGDENALSCTDCKSDKDNLCNPEAKGCDYDCASGIDNDCLAGTLDPRYIAIPILLLLAFLAWWAAREK